MTTVYVESSTCTAVLINTIRNTDVLKTFYVYIWRILTQYEIYLPVGEHTCKVLSTKQAHS